MIKKQPKFRDGLTLKKALAMLPPGPRIHTFRAGGPANIGADWPRRSIIAAIKRYGVGRTGPMAVAMKHGLILYDKTGLLFIATR